MAAAATESTDEAMSVTMGVSSTPLVVDAFEESRLAVVDCGEHVADELADEQVEEEEEDGV